jgi:hypothetical protein
MGSTYQNNRYVHTGCTIKIGEWGTSITGKNLQHAVQKLDKFTREKQGVTLEEYLHGTRRRNKNNGNGGKGPDVDPVIHRIYRRRRA